MPYVWVKSPIVAPELSGASFVGDDPVAELRLWPHRSLSPFGFVSFFAMTTLLVSLPLLAILGSPVLWGVLPFSVASLTGMWWGLKRNWADGEVIEELRLWPHRITLSREGPGMMRAAWEAHPHWVKVSLHRTGGPIPDYVTLQGAGREVEIGAFLSDYERRSLYNDLRDTIGCAIRQP